MNFDLVRGLKALPFFSRKERKVRKEMEDGWRAGVRRAARKNLTRRRGGAEDVCEEMEGGWRARARRAPGKISRGGAEEARKANVITFCSKGEIPYCVSRKRPLDGVCLGRQLDGESRQGKMRKPSKILRTCQPLRPAGSRQSQPPKKPHAKFAKSAK